MPSVSFVSFPAFSRFRALCQSGQSWWHLALKPSGTHVALLVLLLSLLATMMLSLQVRNNEQRIAAFDTDQQTHQILANLQIQLNTQAQLLRSSAAILMLNRVVQRQNWTTYQQQLQRLGWPAGLQLLGYAQRIDDPYKAALVTAMRAEGRPDYRIHPLRTDTAATPVLYAAPENSGPFGRPGFDLMSEPALLPALQRATDTAGVALSHALRAPDGSRQLVMVLPIFPGNVLPDNVAERRKTAVGFVFSVLQIDAVLDNPASTGQMPLAVRLYDDAGHSPSALLYQRTIGDVYGDTTELPVSVFGQTWLLDADTRPAPVVSSGIVALAGTAMSLVLYWLTGLALRSRDAAGKQARRDAREIRRGQLQLGALTSLSRQAIITIDRKQRIVVFNRHAEHLFRTSATSITGAHLSRLLPQRLKGARPMAPIELDGARVPVFRLHSQEQQLARRCSGEFFPFDATIFRTGNWSQKRYTILLDDLSAVKLAEPAPQGPQADRSTTFQQRLAQEIHDDFGQLLTAMKMDIDALYEQAGDVDARLLQRIGSINDLVDAMVSSLRRIMAALPPEVLDEHGLFKALALLVDSHAKRYRIACRLNLPAHPPEVSQHLSIQVYRLMQEALNNVARHAGATTLDVGIDAQAGALTLHIADNGCGIAADAAGQPGALGLTGMQERVRDLHGTMHIDTVTATARDTTTEAGPGSGTTIRIKLPLASHR